MKASAKHFGVEVGP